MVNVTISYMAYMDPMGNTFRPGFYIHFIGVTFSSSRHGMKIQAAKSSGDDNCYWLYDIIYIICIIYTYV